MPNNGYSERLVYFQSAEKNNRAVYKKNQGGLIIPNNFALTIYFPHMDNFHVPFLGFHT